MENNTAKKSLGFLDKIRAAVTNLRRTPADQKLRGCLPNLPTIYDLEEAAPGTGNVIERNNVVSHKPMPSPAHATQRPVSKKENPNKTKRKSSRSKNSEDSAPSCSTSNASSTTHIAGKYTDKYTKSTSKDSSKRSRTREKSQNSSEKESTKRDSNKFKRKHSEKKKGEAFTEQENAPVKTSREKTKSDSRKQAGPSTNSGNKQVKIEERRKDKAPGSASSDAYSSAKSTLSKHSMPPSSHKSKKQKQRDQSSSSSKQSSTNTHEKHEQKEQANKKHTKSKSTSAKLSSKKNQSQGRQSELSSDLENIDEASDQPPPATTANTLVFVSTIVRGYKDTLNKKSEELQLPKGVKRTGTSNTIRSAVNNKKSTELSQVSRKSATPARQSSNLATNRSTQPRHTAQGPSVSRQSVSSQRSTIPSNQSPKPAQGRQPISNKVVSHNVQTSSRPVPTSSRPTQVERSKGTPVRPKTAHNTTSKPLLGHPARPPQACVSTSKDKHIESAKNNIQNVKALHTKDVLCIFTKNNQGKNVRNPQLKEKLSPFPKIHKNSSSSYLKCPSQSKSILLRECNYEEIPECSANGNKQDKTFTRNISRPSLTNALQSDVPRMCEIKEHPSAHVELQPTKGSSRYVSGKTRRKNSEDGQNTSKTICPSRKEIPLQSRLSRDLSTHDSKYSSRSNISVLSHESSLSRPITSQKKGSSSFNSSSQSRTNNQNRLGYSQLEKTVSPIKSRSRTLNPINDGSSKYNQHGNTSRNSFTNRKSFQIRPNTSQAIDGSRSNARKEIKFNNNRSITNQETNNGSRPKTFDRNTMQVRPHTTQSIRNSRTQQVSTQSNISTGNSISEQKSSCTTRRSISRRQSNTGRPGMQTLSKSKSHPPLQDALNNDLKSAKSSSEGGLNGHIMQSQSNTSQVDEDFPILNPSCSTRKGLSSHSVGPDESDATMSSSRSCQDQLDNCQTNNDSVTGLNLLFSSLNSVQLPIGNLSQSGVLCRSTASWQTIMDANTNSCPKITKQSKLSNSTSDEKSRMLVCTDSSNQDCFVKTTFTGQQSNMGLVTGYPVSRLDSDVRCDKSAFVRPSTSFPCTKTETMRCLTQDVRLLSDQPDIPFPLIRDRTYLILPSGPHDENTAVRVGTSGVPILTRQNTYLIFPTKDSGGAAKMEVAHKASISAPAITAKMSAQQVDPANLGEIPLQKETTYLVLPAREATNSEVTDDDEVIPLDKKTTFMILPKQSSSTDTEPERSESEIRLVRSTTYEVIPSKEVYSETKIN